MLTRQRPVVFFDQRGNFFGNHSVLPVTRFGFEVNNWPEVQLTRPCVGVVDRVHVVLSQYLVELPDVVGQVMHVDGGVLDYGNRFGIAGQVPQQTESGFAERPDFFGVVAEKQWVVVAQSGLAQFGFHPGGNLLHLGAGIAREIDH